MPRRTYDPRNGRRRVNTNHGPALEALVIELARRRLVTTASRDCAVCTRSLPTDWPYPEHARCRPGATSTERNNR